MEWWCWLHDSLFVMLLIWEKQFFYKLGVKTKAWTKIERTSFVFTPFPTKLFCQIHGDIYEGYFQCDSINGFGTKTCKDGEFVDEISQCPFFYNTTNFINFELFISDFYEI